MRAQSVTVRSLRRRVLLDPNSRRERRSCVSRVFRRFPSLEAIEQASGQELKDIIEPLGFHNMRSAALKQIADDNDRVLETPAALRDLPHVGPYVANATLCLALSH